jgi:predicted glycosyltransferase
MKVMIVVTHLLGTGHLRRAATLARAFAGAGHGAVLVSGGGPIPGLDAGGADLVQLPPVRSDGVDFTRLLDGAGAPVTPACMDHRSDALLRCHRAAGPDILITELYPFGRRVLRAEFAALLAAARGRTPVILSSVRDILNPPSRPEKAHQAEDILLGAYHGVLVHSDPALVPLDISWPVSDRLAPLLRYTGFVAPPGAGPHPDRAGDGEILVSAGGGAVGDPLYAAALGAARGDGRTWRLLIGGHDAKTRCDALRRDAPPNAIVEPARPDFRAMLHHAACSVSLCGYNTALDLLAAGTPSVLVPFDDGGEREQGLRAASLRRMNGFAILPASDLTPDALRAATRAAMAAPRRPKAAPDVFGGAARTVEIAAAMFAQAA